jgi:methenyltetrahydrofolate cyclohydrolase
VDRVADMSVAALAAALGDRTPAPGGGAACAAGLALAAGLVEMAARFAGDEATAARAAAVREAAPPLAEEDARAYGRVLAEPPERRAAALAAATGPPLAMAEAGAQVAELGARVAREGRAALRGDAVAGVLLAEGATRAAAELVLINLAGARDEERAGRARRLARRASDARAAALNVE